LESAFGQMELAEVKAATVIGIWDDLAIKTPGYRQHPV